MAPSGFRTGLLILGCAFVFALVTGVLAAILPPRKPSDWVAIGTVGTLLSMLTAYLAVVLTNPERKAEVVPRRRVRVVTRQD
jgi:ABC-type antimicrobial peptide transport system permease subunit